MIDAIKGVVLGIEEEKVIVNVHGFGVAVYTSFDREMPKVGNEIFLHTYLSITQNGVTLYGFQKKEDREIFKTVLKVPNVGPKTAFSLVSGLGSAGIRRALDENNPGPIKEVKGIGSKTAKRVILELKDRLELPPKMEFAEAKKALQSLGFDSGEAESAIRKVTDEDEELTVDEIVQKVLRES